MMIFAAAADERSLLVFPSVEAAVAYCEGFDVEEGSWLFWNERGVALEPEFFTPNHHGRFAVGSGTYQLVPAPRLPPLAAVLAGLQVVEANPDFPSVAAVRAHLAAVASVPQHGA
jgi:hypothetical protein